MGQKVHPVGMRVGIIRNWDSRWYAEKGNVPALVKEDADIRKYINTFYKKAAVSHVEIERVKGKGGKDRGVPLPSTGAKKIEAQIEKVRRFYQTDTNDGFGAAWLPEGFSKKKRPGGP